MKCELLICVIPSYQIKLMRYGASIYPQKPAQTRTLNTLLIEEVLQKIAKFFSTCLRILSDGFTLDTDAVS